jgi:hypothetical protein
MPLSITHSRIQHGVGQGAFHSATVEVREGGRNHRFDYVYDCGALKGQRPTEELKRAIQRMDVAQRVEMKQKGVIDLLVLSHYDQDHINGAQLLVQRFNVKRIVVPYMSPKELALVLAAQAEYIRSDLVTELHNLANGEATLFGVDVTMIRTNRDAADDTKNDGSGPAPDFGSDNETDRNEVPDVDPPHSMRATIGGGRRPLGREMGADENVQLAIDPPRWPPLWKLRFWNRGADPTLLKHLYDELGYYRFPIDYLDKRANASNLIQWMTNTSNRKIALKAYRKAIDKYAQNWNSEAASYKLGNFLSLALFSGPATWLAHPQFKFAISRRTLLDGNPLALGASDICRFCLPNGLNEVGLDRMGWLGTGDAPLGESGVWADFSAHYKQELRRIGTVQVPHHGAAPLGGPRFYTPHLNPQPNMLAVISVGKSNRYGHPRAAVINQILSADARVGLVTEDTALGLHEVYVLRTSPILGVSP